MNSSQSQDQSQNNGPNNGQNNPAERRKQWPRPLGLHLTSAMFYSQNWPAVSNSFTNAWSAWKPNSNGSSVGFDFPFADSAFLHAATSAGLNEFQTWLSGVEAYQNAPPYTPMPSVLSVWQSGSTQVFDYTTASTGNPDTVIIVLPSLINKSTVLDLLPDVSLLRTMAQHHAVWLLDWGMPAADERTFAVDDYITQRVLPVIGEARARHKKVLLLGYCMGGLMALAGAACTKVDGLMLLATPWDFYAYPMPARVGLAQLAAGFQPWLQAGHPMTIDMLQMMFALLQPMAVFDKFKKVARDGCDATFAALEDWLNDGVELPAKVAQTCLMDWFQNNSTYAGDWSVGGQAVHPQTITAPALLMVPDNDRIVPAAAALPLADFIPNTELRRVLLGHVGMIVSRAGQKTVWPQLVDFANHV